MRLCLKSDVVTTNNLIVYDQFWPLHIKYNIYYYNKFKTIYMN